MIGVEPATASDTSQSLRAGKRVSIAEPDTIADGLRGALSARTLELMRRHVDDVVTVSDEAIVHAMRTLWQHLKIIVEASSAVPYAAVQGHQVNVSGARVGIILTGGNVDLDELPW